MAEYISERYNYYVYEQTEHHFKGKFLMDSPVPFLIILLSYVLFIKWIGPWWMKDRPRYNVDKPMLLYNIVQMAINGHFVYIAIVVLWRSGQYNVICMKYNDEPDPTDDVLVDKIHLFLLSRLLDFLDTVFMVLKKNNHQVSFLHVYHHLLVAIVGWFLLKYYGGTIVVFFGTVNSFVHVVMYSYYFLTVFDASYKKSIWWKKQITQLQLVQFVFILLHQVVAMFSPSCAYPKPLMYFVIVQAIIMMYLFGQFYLNSYVKSQAKKHS